MEEKTQLKLLVSRKEAEKKIQERIVIGQQLYDRQINSQEELDKAKADFDNWSDYNKTLLLKINSEIADQYGRLRIPAALINSTLNDRIDRYRSDYVLEMVNCLKGIIDQLELYDELLETSSNTIMENDMHIFIVHGHDEAAKHKIARFIENLDLTAIILDEQSPGHTIIDKFEEHADEAGFAIVLLTADDIGAPKNQEDNLQPRARQNVILEFGYFLAELGRKRIGVLYEEGVERPSDIEGLEYIPLDNADGWKIKLAKGMRAAGFTVDLNQI
ncbi:MAG: nucleotide-binding protein [Candidatus Poribacteria bacterium]|nr:nucleotide-binding protein [Candidatus Poribacteria bacterium]